MRQPAVFLALALSASLALAEDWMVRQQVAGSFADTREPIVLATENHGLVQQAVATSQTLTQAAETMKQAMARFSY